MQRVRGVVVPGLRLLCEASSGVCAISSQADYKRPTITIGSSPGLISRGAQIQISAKQLTTSYADAFPTRLLAECGICPSAESRFASADRAIFILAKLAW